MLESFQQYLLCFLKPFLHFWLLFPFLYIAVIFKYGFSFLFDIVSLLLYQTASILKTFFLIYKIIPKKFCFLIFLFFWKLFKIRSEIRAIS